MTLKQAKTILPLFAFSMLALFFWKGLGMQAGQVDSPLINKPLPAFKLKLADNPSITLDSSVLKGKASLLHVWATWCGTCRQEHKDLLNYAAQNVIPIVGLAYKDDTAIVNDWLKQNKNPYTMVLLDEEGKAGIELGVYGTPETYLIDAQGIIRYKYIGALSERVWENKILAEIKKLS